jgi:hypothetical protein
MTNTPEQAIAVARDQSENGPRIDRWLGVSTYIGWCLKAVRTCYDVDAHDFTASNGRDPLAHEAYDYAAHKHPTTDPHAIPRGVPVFWRGGSSGAGHIAISTGDGGCWSTDIERNGYFDRVPIASIGTKWGMTLLGWTEDLNGVRVWTAPALPARVLPPTLVTEARALLVKARLTAGPIRKAAITAGLAVLPKR